MTSAECRRRQLAAGGTAPLSPSTNISFQVAVVSHAPSPRRTRPCGCLVLLLLPAAVRAEVTGPLEALDELAAVHVANRESIETWAGEVRLVDAMKRPDGLDVVRPGSATYAYERGTGTRYVFRYEDAGPDWPPLRFGGLRLGSTNYSYAFHRPGGDVTQGVTVKETDSIPVGTMTPNLFPMAFYGVSEYGGRSVEDFIESCKRMADREGVRYEIVRDADVLRVGVTNLTNGGANVHEFDFVQGGNMIRSTATASDGERWEVDINWEQHGGSWTPVLYDYRQRTLDGKTTAGRKVSWVHQAVNEPLPGGTFALETIEIDPGAWVTDHRTGEALRYEGTQTAATLTEPGGWGRAAVTLAGVLAVAAVAAGMWWRRRGGRT